MKDLKPLCHHAFPGNCVWLRDGVDQHKIWMAYIYERDDEFLLIRMLNDDDTWGELLWHDAFAQRILGTPPKKDAEKYRWLAKALPLSPYPKRPASVPVQAKPRFKRITGQRDLFTS